MNCFPYPGNKARHADWILDHMADHECYVELFGGAAGVLFNKPQSKIEVYNDLNGDIPHFFRVLRDCGDELQEWLRNVPYSREVYDEWATEYYDGHRPDDDIKRAGRFFALRYMQFGGKIDGRAGFATCKKNPSKFAKSLNAGVESLPQFRNRLRNVVVEEKGALELLEKYDHDGAVFYADPPYEGTEGQYNAQGFDHGKLAQKAKEIEGKIIISYDSIPPMYGEQFTVASKNSSFAISQGADKDATEYLIMNYDPEQTPMFRKSGQSGLEAFE